jgi:integrase
MGTVYRRKDSIVFWIKYYRNGKPFYESSKSEKETDAKKLLKLREGEIQAGTFSGLQVKRITISELLDDVVNDYKVNKKRSLDRLELSVKHILGYFDGCKAADISSTAIQKYILHRQAQGAENGTINRELSAMKRAFTLAVRATPKKIINPPYVQMLKEASPREGFLDHQDYMKLKEILPEYLRPLLVAAYHTGMRKGELINLQWSSVDLIEGKISLSGASTKNGKPRKIFLTGELYQTILNQRTICDSQFPDCQYIFFRDGKRIKDFRKSWKTACTAAGLEGLLVHDLRRSGIRGLIRSGVSTTVAMRVSGHLTESVFRRYDITSDSDLKSASEKVSEYHHQLEEKLSRVNGSYEMVTLKANESEKT